MDWWAVNRARIIDVGAIHDLANVALVAMKCMRSTAVIRAWKQCKMVKDGIPKAAAATEGLWKVVRPLSLGGRCGSSAMVKELCFIEFCVSSLA